MERVTQWSRVKQLFGAAIELEPGRRETFLRDACGSDHDLRVELESLLSAHETSSELSQPALFSSFLGAKVPVTIGPYQLVRKLGEGGMGQVWLAEQNEPVRRHVAIKIIRSGLYDGALLQRFQSERQSLAMMDHPAIAKVFEAGSAPNGQPYLVMEYVPGLPITNYCDQEKLGIADRLKLFIAACEGVQHAHQKAIIHRDLKPANILVVEVDGKPAPRIIDFGLAKTMMPTLNEKTVLLTQAGSFLGTPGYMSPEQANPNAQDVDTRTDVYSLGVLLYALLTGSLPFDSTGKSFEEVFRQLREDDPPSPSAKVNGAKDSAARAAVRGMEFRQLEHLLKGDLDWIAMRAIEKDRNRRYGTPSDLAADIRRYLNHEAVLARPASTMYRAKKYVRRHRIGVAMAGFLLLLLGGFAAAQAVQLRRITRERDRADRVTEFMTGMFRVSDPREMRGNNITAREILDNASKDIDTGLARDPELQAQMIHVMGQVYGNLGLYNKTETLAKQALEIRERLFGPKDPRSLDSRDLLIWTMNHEGRFSEAEKMGRAALDIRLHSLGTEHPLTAKSMAYLGWSLAGQGRLEEAQELRKKALAIRHRSLGLENLNTLVSMNDLAVTLAELGHFAEAEKLEREALEIQRRRLGPEHPETLTSVSNLAWMLRRGGQYPEAERLNRETLQIRRRVLGPEHPDTLISMASLSATLLRERRYRESKALLQETLDIQHRVFGPNHPETALSMYNMACVEAHLGKISDALDHLRSAVDHGLHPLDDLGMARDPDLESLRGNPRFEALVRYAREHAANLRTSH